MKPVEDMQVDQHYRVMDRAGNRWEGRYIGHGQPNEEQGVYLSLSDGAIACICFSDVANVINNV